MNRPNKDDPDGHDELSIFRHYARIKGISLDEAKRIINDTCKRLEKRKNKKMDRRNKWMRN